MQTTINLDVGVIVAALAPTIAIVVAAILAKRDADAGHEKLDGIHVLVNDAMTREKRARRDDLLAQKVVLERLLGEDQTDADRRLIDSLDRRIGKLTVEIRNRDDAAAGVTGFPSGSEDA